MTRIWIVVAVELHSLFDLDYFCYLVLCALLVFSCLRRQYLHVVKCCTRCRAILCALLPTETSISVQFSDNKDYTGWCLPTCFCPGVPVRVLCKYFIVVFWTYLWCESTRAFARRTIGISYIHQFLVSSAGRSKFYFHHIVDSQTPFNKERLAESSKSFGPNDIVMLRSQVGLKSRPKYLE